MRYMKWDNASLEREVRKGVRNRKTVVSKDVLFHLIGPHYLRMLERSTEHNGVEALERRLITEGRLLRFKRSR